MAGAHVIFEDSTVRAALQRMKEFDKRGMLEGIGSYMVSSTKQRFRTSRAPDGSPWAPLSEATRFMRLGGAKAYTKKRTLTKAAQRRDANMLPLVDRGHLRNSITYNVSGDRVAIGTNMIYGAIHQFGGPAGRGKRVNIPARPYLGFGTGDNAEIAEIMRGYITRVIK